MELVENEVLTIASLNICGQSGLNLIKQKQIQDFIQLYNVDILACQEINIDDTTFSQCPNISSNFTIISNNAINKYGTCLLITNSLMYESVVRDTDGRIVSVNVGDLTLSNVYLHSGNDRVQRNCRENTISEVLPQILQNSKPSGLCIGDFNCIIDKKDATRNQAEKMSPSLKRLVNTMQWSDVFRLLYPNDLIYSREYDNAVHGTGATRIDHCYRYGEINVIEVNYVGVAFTDHNALVVKIKILPNCKKYMSPRVSPLFKAKPEAVKDEVFKARLCAQYEVWEAAKNTANIPTLDWWERTVKPGIRQLLRVRGRELRLEKMRRINLLQLRQSYLIRKIQEEGRGRGNERGPVHHHLVNLRIVQSEIKQWYIEESEKIKIQSKVDEINENETVRIYHHEIHKKNIRKLAILKLEKQDGSVVEGHRKCMELLESSIESVFGVAPILSLDSQQLLLAEVEPVFSLEDNTMMAAVPSKEEVKKRLWECNVNSSPGSDGLTYLVYKECWDILGDAITEVCVCLHNGDQETISQRLSLMVFTPKPKKADSIKVKDKRTLSLINCDKKLYDCIPTHRLKSISTKGLSQNQLAAGDDRRIYHGINSARDAIQCATARNQSCGIADLDLIAAFNMVSMSWISKVMLAKGLSQDNTARFLNMYRDAAIRVVVNNKVGKEIKVKRCVRQGAPPSMLLFLYNVDPVIVFLEKRLTGILLYSMPVLGPGLPGQPNLPHSDEKYTIKGYADDLKPAITNMGEFVMVDNIIREFEAASGCAIHRDPTMDKCKILLLGGWRRLHQDNIPVPYIKISDHLDMLGFVLMATFTKTRQANGDIVQGKVRNVIGPWCGGKFMPLNERSSSLNTYAFPKIWYKAHMMEYRVKDLNYFDKQGNKWLFADLLEKPIDLIKYRKRTDGGLGLQHIRTKCMSILIKSFIETSCHRDYHHSLYHQALLSWHVYNDRTIPDPDKSPYYTVEFYNIIRSAIDNNLKIEIMTSKDWYNFILSSILIEPGQDMLVPCRSEILFPDNDWQKSWSLARMKGLSSDSLSFLWLMLHGLLPTRDRLNRILPTVTSATCRHCDTGQDDSPKHALALCSASSPVFNWMFAGISMFDSTVTVDKLLLLDITPDNPLPHDELPLVWFIAQVLRRLWRHRRDGRQCRLFDIRAELEAEVNLVSKSRYSDMVVILNQMM